MSVSLEMRRYCKTTNRCRTEDGDERTERKTIAAAAAARQLARADVIMRRVSPYLSVLVCVARCSSLPLSTLCLAVPNTRSSSSSSNSLYWTRRPVDDGERCVLAARAACLLCCGRTRPGRRPRRSRCDGAKPPRAGPCLDGLDIR